MRQHHKTQGEREANEWETALSHQEKPQGEKESNSTSTKRGTRFSFNYLQI